MEKTVKEVEIIELTLRSSLTGEEYVVDCYGRDHLELMVKEVIENSFSCWRVVLTNKFVEDAVDELRREFNSNVVSK